MTPTYYFSGHRAVAAHVSHCLEPLGWKRVDDARLADVAFTYHTSVQDLEDAYFDEGGIVKNAKKGTLLVDCSPATPSFARELSAVATVNDLRPVEAPLVIRDFTLPDAFASPENVLCYAAGEADDVDEVVDVLETIAGTVERTGSSGTAQLAKAFDTIQGIAQAVAAVEADALMRATQLASMPFDAFDAEVKPSTELAAHMLASSSTGSFDGTFTIEMLFADVSAAMAAADDADLILPQLESVLHLLEVLVVIGGADKAPSSLALMYRDEKESAENGLDWARAEELYADFDELGHHHDHGDEQYEDESEEDGGFGFAGGFGGYSAN